MFFNEKYLFSRKNNGTKLYKDRYFITETFENKYVICAVETSGIHVIFGSRPTYRQAVKLMKEVGQWP